MKNDEITFAEESGLIEKVVRINRVAKVVKGGKHISFSVLVVVGDGSGNVGMAIGKAAEVADAIRKGVELAKKSMIKVPLDGTTIPHPVFAKYSASKVILRPAAPGTGVIAGGAVRAVMEAAGIKDVLSKCLGSKNPINVVRATLKALMDAEEINQAAYRRMVSPERIKPKRVPRGATT
ncbi:MAG: 30S ribosomal protein S5 [bacterium]